MSSALLMYATIFGALNGFFIDRCAIWLITHEWEWKPDRYTAVTQLFTIAVAIAALFSLSYHQILVYVPLVVALLVSFVTDMRFFLISRLVTWWLLPVPFVLRLYGMLPAGIVDGLLGMLAGAGFLWAIGKLFLYRRGVEGIGQGDIDMMLLIGLYLGLWGAWLALTIGSLLGAVVSLLVRWFGWVSWESHISFGAYLAIGALSVLLL